MKVSILVEIGNTRKNKRAAIIASHSRPKKGCLSIDRPIILPCEKNRPRKNILQLRPSSPRPSVVRDCIRARSSSAISSFRPFYIKYPTVLDPRPRRTRARSNAITGASMLETRPSPITTSPRGGAPVGWGRGGRVALLNEGDSLNGICPTTT